MQKNVTRGICNIKNKNRFLPNNHEERPSTIFQNVYEHLRSRGTEVVIIGCTDIRVDFSAENTIDSLEVMADAIMKSNSL
jgi:aspartate racemase